MQHYFTFCHFAPDQVAGQKRGVSRIHQLSSFVSLASSLYACVEMVAQSQSGTVMVFIAPQTSSSKCERCCYVSLRKRRVFTTVAQQCSLPTSRFSRGVRHGPFQRTRFAVLPVISSAVTDFLISGFLC